MTMQAPTASTPIGGNIGTIHVAIELSQRSWVTVIHSPDQARLLRHKLEPGDCEGLLALIDKVRQRAARAAGKVPAVVSCYEAGYDGVWLHPRLVAGGSGDLLVH